MPPTLAEEQKLLAVGCRHIAGVDEAGRGCWAGPVTAAAVVLGGRALAAPRLLDGVDDSKKLSAAQRARAFELVVALADDWAVCSVGPAFIDAFGIVPATQMAMEGALLRLRRPPDGLLIDAVRLGGWRAPQRSMHFGDAISLSIAAASVVAKQMRDRRMLELDSAFPGYRFGVHKGYGTAAHADALEHYGVTAQHRRTFAPVLARLRRQEQEERCDGE